MKFSMKSSPVSKYPGSHKVLIQIRVLTDMTTQNAIKELSDYMSELSEEAYYAGWMEDLEYALWDAVILGPKKYGVLDITTNHISKLKLL